MYFPIRCWISHQFVSDFILNSTLSKQSFGTEIKHSLSRFEHDVNQIYFEIDKYFLVYTLNQLSFTLGDNRAEQIRIVRDTSSSSSCMPSENMTASIREQVCSIIHFHTVQNFYCLVE